MRANRRERGSDGGHRNRGACLLVLVELVELVVEIFPFAPTLGYLVLVLRLEGLLVEVLHHRKMRNLHRLGPPIVAVTLFRELEQLR